MLGSVSFVLRATQEHQKLLRRKERVSYLDLGRGLRGEGGEGAEARPLQECGRETLRAGGAVGSGGGECTCVAPNGLLALVSVHSRGE